MMVMRGGGGDGGGQGRLLVRQLLGQLRLQRRVHTRHVAVHALRTLAARLLRAAVCRRQLLVCQRLH